MKTETLLETIGGVRSFLRTLYDLQDLRIQSGNRLLASYRTRQPDVSRKELTPEEIEALNDNILEGYQKEYKAIVEGRTTETGELRRAISVKSIPPGEYIRNYVDYVLYSQYMNYVRSEETQNKMLDNVLAYVPLYTDFLKFIPGVGPMMAAVIVSEIDFTKSKYPSSLHRLAGMDVVKAGVVNDGTGDKLIPFEELPAEARNLGKGQTITIKGSTYSVRDIGRNRMNYSLIDVPYKNVAGEMAIKKSLTYNPWLKTKLLGVLAGSFLKQTKTLVNGSEMTKSQRLALAKAKGFESTLKAAEAIKETDEWLTRNGFIVTKEVGQYAKIYYDYRKRLENRKDMTEATKIKHHRMGLRYMMKIFLSDVYVEGRKMVGMEVHSTYAESKLGLHHGQDPKPAEVAVKSTGFQDPMDEM